MNRVTELLKEYGPMISGDLARLYEKTYGVSNEAARKAISRAKPPVKRMMSFKFDKNQIFCYLESQYMSERYKSSLLEAIKNHSKINQTVLNAFAAQGGYVSKCVLPAFTAAPVEKVQGHKMYKKLLEELLRHELIADFNESTYILNERFFENGNYGRAIGLELAKKVIVNDFNRWAREINLVSFEKGKTLYETPVFAHFQWCYTAPSYVQPLYSYKSEIPGFVIADVFFGKVASVEDLQFFFDKLSIIRSFKNLPKFFQVLLVDKITPEALEELKRQKVMVAILNNFFSDKYTELLGDLVNAFANTTAIVNKNPQMIYKLFEELAKGEGRYNNMAGDMFELLVGCYYSHIGCLYLKSKQLIVDLNGSYKELDWLIERDGKIIVVECKANKSPIGIGFVQKWLKENIPFTRRWLLDNNYNKNMEFQLWSVGGFTEEANEALVKEEASVQKYTISHFAREQMIAMGKKAKDQSFLEIMKLHFGK